MLSRRGYLTTIATGCLAGVAGCQAVLSDDESSGDRLLDAIVANTAIERLAKDGSAEVRTANAQFSEADLVALRDTADELSEGFLERGDASWFVGDPMDASIETYDRTIRFNVEGDTTDDRYVEDYGGYVEGTIQPAAYDARPEIDVEATEYGEYRVYELDDRSVAVNESTMLNRDVDVTPFDDGSRDETAEQVAGVRSLIDDLEEGADPARPVDRGIAATLPYDVVYGDVGFGSDEVYFQGRSWHVEGSETTIRDVYAASSAEAFDEFWSRRRGVEDFSDDADEADLSVDVDDTLATVTGSVSTASIPIADD